MYKSRGARAVFLNEEQLKERDRQLSLVIQGKGLYTKYEPPGDKEYRQKKAAAKKRNRQKNLASL